MKQLLKGKEGKQTMVRTVGIVSLSSGIIGEPFVRHEVEIGLGRLEGYGLKVRFMPHALKGIDYVRDHPEKRAEDLLAAFRDPEIDMILCAIGGDDTYRLLPYLFDHDELRRAVSGKIFLGFSDTTVNHLMLHKVGLKTFYGQAFLPDLCEIGPEMPPYSRRCFEELITTGTIREIRPAMCGTRRERALTRPGSAQSWQPIPITALSCCRGRQFSPGRSSAAVSVRCMISLTAAGMRICRACAGSTVCFRLRKIGRAESFFWKPVRKSPHRRNTVRRWST